VSRPCVALLLAETEGLETLEETIATLKESIGEEEETSEAE